MASPLHELDDRLKTDIFDFLDKRVPEDLVELRDALFTHPEMSAEFFAVWIAYVEEFGGRTAVGWYLEERGWALSAGAQEWLEAQQRSWLSLWEVLDVVPGQSMRLRDRLTGIERTVHETTASRAVGKGATLLARVVDIRSVSLLCGVHPIPMRPLDGLEIAESARKTLRRRTAVTPDRLREPKIFRKLLWLWSETIDRLKSPPEIRNTDGDPFVLTRDRWTFDPDARDEILERIANLEGAERDDADDAAHFAIVREDQTLTGTIRVEERSIVAETNSANRSEALRRQIENACTGLLAAQLRSHADPMSSAREPATTDPFPETDEESMEVARQFKERHYAGWPDQPLPALDGKTPREAMHTKHDRARVKALVDNIEFGESTLDEAERFDAGILRRDLGLDEN